jgi:hypothetical protein
MSSLPPLQATDRIVPFALSKHPREPITQSGSRTPPVPRSPRSATPTPVRRSAASRGNRARRPGEIPDRARPARCQPDARPWQAPKQQRGGRRCCDRLRTIWAASHLRAARPLWCENGGRGGVSELGGGEQPTAETAAHRRRGRPRPGRGVSPVSLAGPAMPDRTKAIEGHPRPHARACVWRPPRGLEMCLAQADSTPMARSQ